MENKKLTGSHYRNFVHNGILLHASKCDGASSLDYSGSWRSRCYIVLASSNAWNHRRSRCRPGTSTRLSVKRAARGPFEWLARMALSSLDSGLVPGFLRMLVISVIWLLPMRQGKISTGISILHHICDEALNSRRWSYPNVVCVVEMKCRSSCVKV